MYSVYADDLRIYDDTQSSNLTLKLVNPKLTMAENSAGSFSCSIPVENVGYDSITLLATTIFVYREDELLWSGRVLSEDIDFWNNRKITCEGDLAFLNDTIQPAAAYENKTVAQYFEALLTVHNTNIAADRQILIGDVTVTDPDNSTYSTNFESTLDAVNDVVSALGGHLRIRRENGNRYLDYLEDYPGTNTQSIEFGKNLLDFTKNFDAANFTTVLLPLGAKDDYGNYVTVEMVNEGSKYVISEEAYETYGRIEKMVQWENVATPTRLMEKAQEYLSDLQFNLMTIDLTALDLSLLSSDYEPFEIFDQVRVISPPHGMDRYFPVTKVELPLDSPEQSRYTLGGTVEVSLTNSTNSTTSKIISIVHSTAQETVKQIEDNTLFREFINDSYISISEGSEIELLTITINTSTSNTGARFHTEIIHDATTNETVADDLYTENDLKVIVRYYINGTLLSNHIPIITEQDGRHTIDLMNYFTILPASQVQFKMTIEVESGGIIIPVGGAKAYIDGNFIDYDGEWTTGDINVSASDDITNLIII